MEGVTATAQVVEGDAVGESITVLPVIIQAFHPVHELQAFALVVIAGTKLHGEGRLVIVELYLVCLVHGLVE